MNELILWHLAFFVLSAHFYIWDKNKKGKLRTIYIWFNNFTSPPEKKITESDKGFVYNQKTKAKIAFASVLSFIFTAVLLVIPGTTSIPTEILLFFTEVPTITIGLFAGIPLEKLYVYIKGLITVVDKVENKEIDIGEEINGAVENVKSSAKEFANNFTNDENQSESGDQSLNQKSDTSSQQQEDEALAKLKKIR